MEISMKTNLLDSNKQVKHNVFQGEMINSISTGYCHSAALTESGRLFLWGCNAHSQLGNGNIDYSLIPIDIAARFHLINGETIKSVSLGTSHSSALTSLGRLFMWGKNYNGELGDGTTANSSKPIDISKQFEFIQGERIIQTSLGSEHSSALTSEGRLFMWGSNGDGELGDGTTKNRRKPLEITKNFKLNISEFIILVRINQSISSALTSRNRLFVWGENNESRYKPVDVTSNLGLQDGETILDINVELWLIYILTSNSRILYYSYEYGMISFKEDLSNKISLVVGEAINQISFERFHYGVLTSLGRLFLGGNNESGQLGDRTRNYREKPVDITLNFNLIEGEYIKTVSLGSMHSSALTSLGRLFMWGENYNGELGDGGEKNRLTPLDITSGSSTARKD
jgi:alpha-tubulin suppressor-like RCC1 family protein